MGLAHIAVEGFKIEFHLAKVLRFESCNLKIKSNQAIQGAIEEEGGIHCPPRLCAGK
jgi:hypothetical protein